MGVALGLGTLTTQEAASPMQGDARNSLIWRVIGYGLSLMSVVLVSRLMGPTGKGILSLGAAVPGLVAVLAGLGLATSTTIAGREGWLPTRPALAALAIYAALAGALFMLAAVVAASAGWFGFGNGPMYATAAAASIGGLLLADYCGGLLQGVGAVSLGMWIRQAVGIGLSVVTIGLVAAGARDPLPVLVGIAVCAWACAAIGSVMVLRHAAAAGRPAPAAWLRRLAVVGIRIQTVWVLLTLNYRLDMVLLGLLGSVAEVGVYSIAVGFSEVAWFGVNALTAVLLPHLINVDPSIASARTARAARLSIISTVMLSALLALGLWASAVPVFGRGFSRSTAAFVALTPGLVAFSAFKVLAIYGVAAQRVRPVTIMALAGVALNVMANVVLIPRFGSVGAGLASSVSYSAISIVAVLLFLRRSGLRFRDAFMPVRSDLLAIAAAGYSVRKPRHDS